MSEQQQTDFDDRAIRARFDRVARGFDDAAFLHRRAGSGLLSRLAPLRIEPGLFVDLGAATGRFGRDLVRRYRGARLVSVDASVGMLREARRARRWFSTQRFLASDARALGLRDETADLVCANLLLPWVCDPDAVFAEVNRVLRDGRPFAFSSLGPDSFRELRVVWDDLGVSPNQPAFIDMHDLGDALMRAGFSDPVLDTERIEIRFSGFEALWRDLRASGSGNPLAARPAGLATPRRRRQFGQAWQRHHGDRVDVSIELVFGHAWSGRTAPVRGGSTEFAVDVGQIRRRR